MVIDFTEIPEANKGGGRQDLFEQFVRDFLETIGYKIIHPPDRGPDGKKDMIIEESVKGINTISSYRWLVSCKHNAHSGRSVKDTDEPNILERLRGFKCDGFMGVYSTIQASSLTRMLEGLTPEIGYFIYDSSQIEKWILNNSQKERVLRSYFPISFDNYRKTLSDETKAREEKSPEIKHLSEDVLLQITITAQIVLEINKIKEACLNTRDWEKCELELEKLFQYSDFNNSRISHDIFSLLYSLSGHTRADMPQSVASTIDSLILTFYPTYSESLEADKINLGRTCLYIGSAIAYDALIYLNSFDIAKCGLQIIKFIYREAKRSKLNDLGKEVFDRYDELESTLNRPERNDLEDARELVKIFKRDLDEPSLSYPVLPKSLYERP